jgi:2'-5' RNA ligase
MERLFVAIPLPKIVKQHLSLLHGGVPGARWQTHE